VKGHDHTNLAPVLIGSAGGKLATGQAIDFKGAPLGNLYVSLLAAFGTRGAQFGTDGVVPLKELLA